MKAVAHSIPSVMPVAEPPNGCWLLKGIRVVVQPLGGMEPELRTGIHARSAGFQLMVMLETSHPQPGIVQIGVRCA